MKTISFFLLLISLNTHGAITAAGCKEKVKTAIESGTGKPMQEGVFNVLLYICEGIVEEIQTNGTVIPDLLKANVGGTLYPVVNTGKIQ